MTGVQTCALPICFSATVPGTYSVVVTDANGCMGANSGVLSQTTPHIAVIKEVICKISNSGCDELGSAYDGHKSATGVKAGTQCPAFCYRIIVLNDGTCPLTSVTVNDPLFGGALGGYPTSLAVGDTATNFFQKTLCADTQNRVIASGASGSVTVTATNFANVVVKQAGVTCSKQVSLDGVNFSNSVQIPQDGAGHLVVYKITVTNTSDPGVVLANLVVSDPLLTGCDLASQTPATLGSGSFSVICSQTLNCANISGGKLINTSTVSADVSSEDGAFCVTQSDDLPVSVSSTCQATVECVGQPGCRTTGGGKQPTEDTCPPVNYVTHGGQVGAPFAQASTPDCATDVGFNNPCIRGEYQHVRHSKGGSGNFHAASNGNEHDFDSLMCACLPCDHTDIASPFGGCHPADRVYAGANPLQPGKHFGLCNPGDRICGPEPRKAPANKICFSGVGDFTDSHGKRTENKVVFRVDLEDRSEPGGAHPGGGKAPPDRYRMRMWIVDPTQVDSAAVKALRATVACKDALTEVIPSTLDCLHTATPAPDIDDGGDLDRGNRQIHPTTGARCD